MKSVSNTEYWDDFHLFNEMHDSNGGSYNCDNRGYSEYINEDGSFWKEHQTYEMVDAVVDENLTMKVKVKKIEYWNSDNYNHKYFYADPRRWDCGY